MLNAEFFISDPAIYGTSKPMARLEEQYQLLERVLAFDGTSPDSWVCSSLPKGMADVLEGRLATFASGLNAYSITADAQWAVVQCDGGPQIEECRVCTRDLFELRQFHRNNYPTLGLVCGNLTNHFSKPGNRSICCSHSAISAFVNVTPLS